MVRSAHHKSLCYVDGRVYPFESEDGLSHLKWRGSEYFVLGIVQRPAGTITHKYEPNF